MQREFLQHLLYFHLLSGPVSLSQCDGDRTQQLRKVLSDRTGQHLVGGIPEWILRLKSKLPLASFFRMINTRPMASALVETTARGDDTELLKDLYYQDDRPIDGSNVLLSEALSQTELPSKTEKLHLASRLLVDSKDATVVLQQKLLSEASQLLKVQEALDKDIADRSEFVGLSLNETIYRLIRSGYGKRAQKLQSEFKMPDKTYWWLRLRALVAKRDWGELEEIGRNKKSPIGWEVSQFLTSFCCMHARADTS